MIFRRAPDVQTPAQRAELTEQFAETIILRTRIAYGLEALLWIIVLAWLSFLVRDIWIAYRHHDEIAGRSLFELSLLGLLVWWPMIRHRIRFGIWL